ncbi:hypothetical protein STSP2_02902 [Anaerohalosphaera lusitana]|uniref:DUF4340 domain-containing protein n=1 Tax=Anaerohalosphaera lusitana TaxID=1936003 RepID=A0A1U9NPI7_9BACT|nr:DUF4340 domain-containing protein [Anaerohalosphaera lusitana]AQT69707.1 hypothetical protein STSP2_02902 [Anaerohalosphaera lusitana]
MNNRKLAILGLLAVVIVVLAVAVDKVTHRGPQGSGTGGYLIEGMDPAKIARIEISGGESDVVLVRGNGGFVVETKGGYPAKTSEVNNLLTRSMDIALAEKITSDEKNYADLGVSEEEASTIVKFITEDGSLLTGIVIGEAVEGGEGKYVRLLNGEDVFVSLGSPWINKNAIGYVEQTLVSAEKDNIESVAVNAGDESYRIVRKDNNEIGLSTVPEGKEVKEDELDKVFNAATSIRFDDVLREVEGVSFNDKFVVRMEDSTVYRFDIGRKDDAVYGKVTAEFTDTEPVTMTKGVQVDEEELKQKEAKLVARDKAQAFAAKNEDWIFEIPSYKADNMTKPLSDLLEDKAVEEESGDEADQPAEAEAAA